MLCGHIISDACPCMPIVIAAIVAQYAREHPCNKQILMAHEFRIPLYAWPPRSTTFPPHSNRHVLLKFSGGKKDIRIYEGPGTIYTLRGGEGRPEVQLIDTFGFISVRR